MLAWSKYSLIDLVKVLERPCRIGFDGGRLWFPVCGADLAMFLHELESFNEAKGFIYRSAHGKIIDGHLPDNTLGVNQEETSESYPSLLDQNAVVPGNGFGEVRHKGVAQTSQTTLFPRHIDPG